MSESTRRNRPPHAELLDSMIPVGKRDQDQISVTRNVTYNGPRAWVELTLAKSLPEGETVLGPDRSIWINQDK